jgi:hypothetical protein
MGWRRVDNGQAQNALVKWNLFSQTHIIFAWYPSQKFI